ncbi:MAG TPA: LD-carboxypeptidase [Oscillatoriaceae cyanobacterium M33_DOE_052]|uniref:LD-carboxypeptidase n=1 Tax=Planktothricoides sp. SpSt-374 TaxID=2282167 RepID=A0A7C3VJW8_9CYAN|nr:LD-carboxypeptidase [Oscillatoriaceae cyanobacterium M33_DOE_052]
MANISRRQFGEILGMSLLASQLPKVAAANSATIVKPPRLQPGDTVGLISPASPVDREDVADAVAAMNQLGLKAKLGAHILDEYGYLAGSDANRAADVNTMFRDGTVKAIITMRGGWGCNRILPLLDYNLIRQNPKIIIGFSDITSLLLAIYARTGIVTFHGPVGISSWNSFSVNYFQRLLFAGESVTLRNPRTLRVQTITGGQTRGRLVGGNLSVIASMLGSDYLPDWGKTILFVEEIDEHIYSIDRLLTQLKIAGILDKIAGFIFAECTDCTAGEGDEPSLTLNQVLQDIIKPLGIPAWYGAAIGHIRDKFTVPLGVEAEIDAGLGTIRLLESAVM